MIGKYSELSNKFREKANDHNFLCFQYSNKNEHDLWSCICSSMDWIDVGVQYIENFQPPNHPSLLNCMEIFSFIQAIDITYEAIKSLFWALVNNGEESKKGRSPFYEEKGCFSSIKNNTITDDKFFKEIRACCGAHPTDLYTYISDDEPKKQERYASWICAETNSSFSVRLYPNDTSNKTITVNVSYAELMDYFEKRFYYLNNLIDKIDELFEVFREEKINDIIQKSSNPIEQLKILKDANADRLDNQYFDETIEQLLLFFNTQFESKENESIVENYREKLISGIDELYENIQKLEYKEMKLNKLLSPPTIDIEWFGYEYTALLAQVFENRYKRYHFKTLTEPLKKYVNFDNIRTQSELYWLITIALNIVDEQNGNKAK